SLEPTQFVCLLRDPIREGARNASVRSVERIASPVQCIKLFLMFDSTRPRAGLFLHTVRGGSQHQFALVALQTLTHGAELVCKCKQGSSCVEFLGLVSKG